MNTKIKTFSWVFLVCLYFLFGGISMIKAGGDIPGYTYIHLFFICTLICLPICGIISFALSLFRNSEFKKTHNKKLETALGLKLGVIGFLTIFTGVLLSVIFKLWLGQIAIILGFIVAFAGIGINIFEMFKQRKQI